MNYRRHFKFNANSVGDNLALPYPSVGSAELGLTAAPWCRAVPWQGGNVPLGLENAPNH